MIGASQRGARRWSSVVVSLLFLLGCVLFATGAVGAAPGFADGDIETDDGSTAQVTDGLTQESAETNATGSFVAASQGGFVSFAQETESDARENAGVEFPTDADDEQIEVDATVEGGVWESTETNFPVMEAQASDGFEVVVTAPDGLSGEIDREAGLMTVRGELRVNVRPAGEEDEENIFFFSIDGTTGDSNALSGSSSFEDDTATVTVVDNEFLVEDETGTLVDGVLGLPAETEGENWFELTLDLDLSGEEAAFRQERTDDETDDSQADEGQDDGGVDDQDDGEGESNEEEPTETDTDDDETVDLALTVLGQAVGFVGIGFAVLSILVALVARFTGVISLE